MTVSLANNLFSANAGLTFRQPSDSQSTQFGQTEGNFTSDIVANENTQQTLSDNPSEFQTSFAKKLESKDIENNQDKDTETNDNSANQDLSLVIAIPNVTINTNTDVVAAQSASSDTITNTTDTTTQQPVIPSSVATDIQPQIPNVQQDQQSAIEESAQTSDTTALTPETTAQDQAPIIEGLQTVTPVEVEVPEIQPKTIEPQIETAPAPVDSEPTQNIESELPVENQTETIDASNAVAAGINPIIPEVETANTQTLQDSAPKIENSAKPASSNKPDTEKETKSKDTANDSVIQPDTIGAESSDDALTQPQISSSVQNDMNDNTPSKDSADSTLDIDTNNNSFVNNLQSAAQDNTADVKNISNESKIDTPKEISTQVHDSIKSTLSADNKEIVIQLNPPELGKLEIKFTEDSSGLTGVLSVDNSKTRHEIQQSLPEIINNLQDSGVNIKKIEVVLSNNQEQQTMKDQSMAGQNNWFNQQNSNQQNQQNNSANTGVYNRWTANDTQSYSPSSESQYYSQDSINMLV
jgi:flagellar hook-length control protein FliK